MSGKPTDFTLNPRGPVKSASDLGTVLRGLDGRGYKAYKAIAGAWDFGDFTLHVDHVQGDPFAAPSRVLIDVKRLKLKNLM